MPFLKIQTSAKLADQKIQPLLKQASRLVAQALGKPEQYMMVSLDADRAMMFAGTAEPTAFVELKSIGLPTGRTGELSRLLSGLVESELRVAKERIYINFADVPASLWGWNGETF